MTALDLCAGCGHFYKDHGARCYGTHPSAGFRVRCSCVTFRPKQEAA